MKVCQYCGASLEYGMEGPSTTAKVQRDTNALSPAVKAEVLEQLEAPSKGFVIYIHDFGKPMVIEIDHQITLGRVKTEPAPENLIDLTPFGAYENGVSQKHALVRRKGKGYEILDIGSTNGTWLNRKRLVPNQPYRLQSGDQIHLGRLSIHIIFH